MNPIHQCNFESGKCRVCGTSELPFKPPPQYGSVTYEQMDRLISSVRSIDNSLYFLMLCSILFLIFDIAKLLLL